MHGLTMSPDACTANVTPTLGGSIYGPYRCTCPEPCSGCMPENKRQHREIPKHAACAVCEKFFIPRVSQVAALTKGQNILCSVECRRVAAQQYAGITAREMLKEKGETVLYCSYCDRPHLVENIDHRRLSNYRRYGRFFCPDTNDKCARAMKNH